MTGRRDHPFPMAAPDQYEPSYAMYENGFQQQFPRAAGPPAHFDGVAFWYRPEPQEAVYDHHALLYNQNMPIPHSPLEQTMSIKHRRTRSGCFTCRHRRVKCDETRPMCERCKKGNRECQFPQPSSSSSSSRRLDPHDPRNMPNKMSSQDVRDEPVQPLSTIDDDSEDEKEGSISPVSGPPRRGPSTSSAQAPKTSEPRRRLRRKSNPIEVKGEESPQSFETASPHSRADTPTSLPRTPPYDQRSAARSLRWKHLSPAMQQYLQFHHDHITRYHYFLKLDPSDFIHNNFIDVALSFEPLLHAVIGFSAYHHTLGKEHGQFQDFWKYYCSSIELLRKWLRSHTDRNEAVLLTILQLATFEEYLGDWAGLASHQSAAHSIFKTLYTYETIMENPTSRCIFDWLARADVALSLMAGTTSILDRQWFITALQWHQSQVDPDILDATTALPCFIAKLRLIGFDMATIFAGAASNPNTMQNIKSVSKRMDSLRLEIQALHKTTYSARSISSSKKGNTEAESAFDPRIPLFRGNLWPLNFIWVDWYSTEQMHKYQTALFTQALQAQAQSRRQGVRNPPVTTNPTSQSLPPELEKLSLIQCQIFEAIERHPRAPSGAILACQASLALSSVFLKKVPKYTMWARRKLANVERLGYIWPPSFRKRMAQLWEDEEVLDWWLPDNEHKIDLLDEIREVVEERNREIEDRGGDERDDLREIKAIFDKLDFGKSGLRTRKDSMWSVTETEGGRGSKLSSPDESEDSEDDDSDDDEHITQQNRRESRDSGVGASSVAVTAAATRRSQPMLEYSNRMSGIWEGPFHAGQ